MLVRVRHLRVAGRVAALAELQLERAQRAVGVDQVVLVEHEHRGAVELADPELRARVLLEQLAVAVGEARELGVRERDALPAPDLDDPRRAHHDEQEQRLAHRLRERLEQVHRPVPAPMRSRSRSSAGSRTQTFGCR